MIKRGIEEGKRRLDKVSRWTILDGYYVPTRYPNSLPDSIPARVFTREAAML